MQAYNYQSLDRHTVLLYHGAGHFKNTHEEFGGRSGFVVEALHAGLGDDVGGRLDAVGDGFQALVVR